MCEREPQEVAREFADLLFDGDNRSTVDRYKRGVRYWVEWCQENSIALEEAEGRDVKHFLRETTREYSDSEAKVRRAAVSNLYQEMDFDENPSEELDMKWSEHSGYNKEDELRERDHYLKDDEFEKLLQNVAAPSKRNKLILRVLHQTGCRVGECAKLRTSDIAFNEELDCWQLHIQAEKTDSSRGVPIREGLQFRLSRWIDEGRESMGGFDPGTDWLFPSERRAHITGDAINTIVTEAAERAGIQETLYVDAGGGERKMITGHTLRFTRAKKLSREKDIAIRDIKEFLGHESVGQTEHYLRAREQAMQEAVSDTF